ncbi:hypothetical protein HN709_00165 [Candidatus Peregrinibacteria bacterium]|jgi:hypothetical protein|nr:hypothetical protein [Candidatus Peregrinibacteria bacterium]MBT7736086.1 hypothetical protein [Candidatus Peregrinibacteria bacterium]
MPNEKANIDGGKKSPDQIRAVFDTFRSEVSSLMAEIDEVKKWDEDQAKTYVLGISDMMKGMRESLSTEEYSDRDLQLTMMDLFQFLYAKAGDVHPDLKFLAKPGESLKEEISSIKLKDWTDQKVQEFLMTNPNSMYLKPKIEKFLGVYGALGNTDKVALSLIRHLYLTVKDAPDVSSRMKTLLTRASLYNPVEFNDKWMSVGSKKILKAFRGDVSKIAPWSDKKVEEFVADIESDGGTLQKCILASPKATDDQKALLKSAFYRTLYVPLLDKADVSEALVEKIRERAVIDEGLHAKIRGNSATDVADGLLPKREKPRRKPKRKPKFDPLMQDPLGISKSKEIPKEDVSFDDGMQDFFLEALDQEIETGKWSLTPVQRLIVAVAYENFFATILYNIKELKEGADPDELIDLSNKLELWGAKSANKLARVFLKKVVLDCDLRDMREIFLGLAGMIDTYEESFISKLTPAMRWRMTVARKALMWTLDYDPVKETGDHLKESMGYGEAPMEMGIVRELVNLSGSTATLLDRLSNRDIDAVAESRPNEPHLYRRQQLLLHFLVTIRENPKITRSNRVYLDFAIGIIARMKDDKELAELGQGLRGIIEYAFTIPAVKDYVKSDKFLSALMKKEPTIFKELPNFFLPEAAPLDTAAESEYNRKYRKYGKYEKSLTFIESLLERQIEKMPPEVRYLAAFAFENIKTSYAAGNKVDAARFLVLATTAFATYQEQIPEYAELKKEVETLQKA